MKQRNSFTFRTPLLGFATLFLACATSCKTPENETPNGLNVSYQDDSRRSYKDFTEIEKKWAEATVALVKKSSIQKIDETHSKILAETAAQKYSLCLSDGLNALPSAAVCSGFLSMDQQTVYTAGHCVDSQWTCENTAVVFNYNKAYETKNGNVEVIIPNKDIYSCKSLIAQAYHLPWMDPESERTTKPQWYGRDYAVFKIDKPNKAIEGLDFQKSNEYLVDTKLKVIGHPLGAPTTVAEGVVKKDVSLNLFLTDLDGYGVNSGSVVIDTEAQKIAGIFVTGPPDTEWIEMKTSSEASYYCRIFRTCKTWSLDKTKYCYGEGVTKAKLIRDINPLTPPKFNLKRTDLGRLPTADMVLLAVSENQIKFEVHESAVYRVGFTNIDSFKSKLYDPNRNYYEEIYEYRLIFLPKGKPYTLIAKNRLNKAMRVDFKMEKVSLSDFSNIRKISEENPNLAVSIMGSGKHYVILDVRELPNFNLSTQGQSDPELRVFIVDQQGNLYPFRSDDDSGEQSNATIEFRDQAGLYLVETILWSNEGQQGSATISIELK